MEKVISRVKQVIFQGQGPAFCATSIGNITSHVHFNGNKKAELAKKCFVDFPDELFTGRDDELQQLHASLHRNSVENQKTILSQTTIIVGLGGIGKTQLVRKYAQVYEHEHQHIIWINSESLETLRYSFQELANKLEIATSSNDTESIVENVYYHLAPDNCLLIFDNAEIDTIFKFLPSKCYDNSYPIPFILITSRNNEWIGVQVEIVQLKELKMFEAIDLVKKGLAILDDDQSQDIKDLVELIQFYPLAIHQAIAYIRIERITKDSKFTVGKYVLKYREREQAAKLLGFSFKGFKYGFTTITTLQLSLAKIQSNDHCGNTAMAILYVMGYLAPISIQRESLKYLIIDTEDGIVELKSAVSLLVQYSVVSSECGGEEAISIHRITQEVLRIALQQKRQEEEILAKTLQLLDGGFLESENTSHIGHVWKYASQSENLVVKHYDRDVSAYSYNAVDGYTTLHFLVREMKYNEIVAILSTLSKSERLLTSAIHATDKYGNSALHVAARDGHLNIVRRLIEKGADVNMENEDGQSPLHLAVRRNNCLDMVKHLTSSGADVNCVDKNGMPLLFIAFCHCPYDETHINWTKSNGKWYIKTDGPKNTINLEIADVPIQSDVVIDETDLATRLLKSLKMNHFEKSFELIQQIVIAIDFGTQIQIHKESKYSLELPSLNKNEDDISKVLRHLKQSEDFFIFECTPKPSNLNVEKLDVVEHLIQCGAKLNDAIKNSTFSCLQWAAQNNENVIFEFFLKNGADVNSNSNGNTPLMAAVGNDNVDIVKLIVDHPNADVNNCSFGTGMTPLHVATLRNNIRIVELLLNKGADMNASFYNQTPPMLANDLNFREILKLFIEHGADLNNCSLFLESPLHNAAKDGDFEFAKYLVDRSANVNAENVGKFTPLHYSVRQNFFNITELLFKNGADPTISNINGTTPKQTAARICNIKMLELFGVPSPESYARSENFKILIENWSINERETLQSFLKIVMKNVENIQEYTNAYDVDGNTPLIWAVRNSSIVAAEVLLEYGVDVNIKNSKKETALHFAVNSIQPEFVRLLLENNINPSSKDRNGKTPFDVALKMSTENPTDQKIKEIFELFLSHQNDSKSQCYASYVNDFIVY